MFMFPAATHDGTGVRLRRRSAAVTDRLWLRVMARSLAAIECRVLTRLVQVAQDELMVVSAAGVPEERRRKLRVGAEEPAAKQGGASARGVVGPEVFQANVWGGVRTEW